MQCDHGDKVAYTSRDEALRTLVDCKIARVLRGNQRRREQRTYQCHYCRSWFLTSREDVFAHL